MNYAEYKVLKDSLERRLRIVSIVPIFIFLAVIFQFVILVVGAETNATWFNVILIDQLYSNFCYRNLRFAYQVLIAVYLVDTALAVVSINYYQIVVHLIFLAVIIYGSRNIRHLDSITKDVWGFFD